MKPQVLISKRRCLLGTGLSLPAFLLLGGCGSDAGDTPEPIPSPCPAVAVFLIMIEVFDVQSGAPINGVSGEIVEGSYREQLRAAENRLAGAENREGIYTLTVRAAGYNDSTRTGLDLRTPAGQCPQSTRLTVQLTRRG